DERPVREAPQEIRVGDAGQDAPYGRYPVEAVRQAGLERGRGERAAAAGKRAGRTGLAGRLEAPVRVEERRRAGAHKSAEVGVAGDEADGVAGLDGRVGIAGADQATDGVRA